MRPGKYFRAVQLFLLCLLAASPLFLMAQAYPPNGAGIPTVALTGSAPIQQPPPSPPDQQSQWNMELVGHSDLQGRSARVGSGTCFGLWGPRPTKFMMSPTRRTRPDLR